MIVTGNWERVCERESESMQTRICSLALSMNSCLDMLSSTTESAIQTCITSITSKSLAEYGNAGGWKGK